MSSNNESEQPLVNEFSINLTQLLLALESADLLVDPCDESHPLRRVNNSPILRIIWDSRELTTEIQAQQHNFIFIARKGSKFDGHTLVEQILGSSNIFIGNLIAIEDYLRNEERPEEWIGDIVNHPLLVGVTDTELALRCILDAATGIKAKDFMSVAITGTSGKTSAVQIIASLLEQCSRADVMRIGTLGIQTKNLSYQNPYPTMPDYSGFLSALVTAQKQQINQLVFEATSHGLIERRMGNWLVDVAVFTNFSQDHLDFHKTMEAYRSCKGILFEQHVKENGYIILNIDDPEWLYFSRRTLPKRTHIIGYGSAKSKDTFNLHTKNNFKSVSFLEIKNPLTTHKGIEGQWILHSENTNINTAHYSSHLLGEFQHHNLAAAAAALIAKKFALSEIAAYVPFVQNIAGRLETVCVQNDKKPAKEQPTVLVDYAHKPDALEKTLTTLQKIKPQNGKVIVVFGCGGDRDSLKRPMMGKIAESIADTVIVTSDNPRTENPEKIIDQILAGTSHHEKIKKYLDRKEAIFAAISEAGSNDIVVIAGKGHENYQIIGDKKIHFSDMEVAEEALQKI